MYLWIAILGLFHFGIRPITIFECFDGWKGFLISIIGQLDYFLVMALDKWTVGVCFDQKLEVEKELIEQEMNLSSSYKEKKRYSKALKWCYWRCEGKWFIQFLPGNLSVMTLGFRFVFCIPCFFLHNFLFETNVSIRNYMEQFNIM